MKRMLCLVLSLALALTACAVALGESSARVTDQEVTLTFMRSENAAVPFVADTPAYRQVQERTGVKLEITEISGSDYNTKMMALYAANELPDLFDGFGMTKREMAEDGMILDLTDLIQEYAPNITAAYEAYPDLYRTMVDGRIYSLPRFRMDQNLEAGASPFIRMDLLKESGLPVPATWDELYDTLDKLGEIYGMIGWGARGIGRIIGTWTYLWMDSFGAHYGSYKNGEGEWRIGRAEPEYKDAIAFLRKMIENGVLDSEFLNMSSTEWQEGLSSGKYLFWYDNATFASGINTALGNYQEGAYFEPLPLLENPYGNTESYKQPTHYTDRFYVSANTEDPVLLVKFLNWCYSEEAAITFAYGREGETYYLDEAGEPHYTQETLEHYLSLDDSYYQACSELGVNDCYFTSAWLNLPTEAFRATAGNAIDAKYIFNFYYDDLMDGTIREMDVAPPLDPEQTSRIQAITQKINSVCETEFVKFVMGTRPMDEYDDFIASIRDDTDEWAEILNEAEAAYQAAYQKLIAK